MDAQNAPFNEESHSEVNDVIKPINRNTVHRICSGQVVLSLAIAVKELVENAIDAGAKSIDIRLKDYGSELIEVSDNGCGVRSDNFEALALKYHTSKITEFSDLESVTTLGFRGEALSSLCALSDITITTRHASSECASKIFYDSMGNIRSQIPAAREIGTTVTLANLFSTLPVRRKEFQKNLKKEYCKMCQLLYAYCLVAKGIKLTCSNEIKNGSRSTVLCTEGSNLVRDNIISVFGTKQIQSLVEVKMLDPDEDVLEEYKIKLLPNDPLPFNFEFLISAVLHGSGRSTNDRQFFYINDRPCEPNRIIKLINETYKQFNPHQFPFVFLNVVIKKSFVDVNVTPDKRQIFLENEKLLLATLKTSLRDVLKSGMSTVTISNSKLEDRSEDSSQIGTPLKFNSFKKHEKKKCGTSTRQASLPELIMITHKSPEKKLDELIKVAQNIEEGTHKSPEKRLDELIKVAQNIEEGNPAKKLKIDNEEIELVEKDDQMDDKTVSQKSLFVNVKKDTKAVTSQKCDATPKTNSITIRSSLNYIRECIAKNRLEDNKEIKVRFRSKIAPDSNKAAEQELQKQITKDMFEKMEIIGQFNLGFIITKFEDDLFIVDQHATDEKYNFEELQRNTVMESQTLVTPRPLELSAGNEELLIENEDVFRRNGFKFVIEHEASPTKKVKLSAVPISKSFVFGKDDIEEILFMMQEEVNHAICRPSRVRSMLASRACRKSVMVGCPLNQNDMRRLIDHMGTIDQPWNCPHGRPTIRHLINLQLLGNN
ncbi:hypothetical protein RI129_010862 [Pyrocoelia pectoralis]|uniref:Mismatch repair endonuclease PMS2 n=1 Tax=Pyrocoelia pectoralis TaxID=417401 RepID=A0AAN7V7R9_9COLE